MSNPTNIPSLLQLAGSCVINNNLTSNPDLDEVTKYRCRSGLLAIWDDLRFHPNQRFCLGSIMWNLQESVVKDYLLAHHLSVITFDEKRAILCEKVDLLFRKLAQKFDAESLFGSVIPVDFLSYDCLQQKFEDEALEIMWSKPYYGISFKLGPDAPNLETANEIRAWITNPENAPLLAEITQLDFSGSDLKAIPPEILNLPQLGCLFLNNNQITFIPEEIENSQLEVLHLENNQITSIPETIVNSQLGGLFLDNNQITFIPVPLAKSPLRKLSLNKNQITFIPEAFANSPLKVLCLDDNQITFIPVPLANSQLEGLDLCKNRITFIPKEFANSPLRSLSLCNNQIAFIPKEFANSRLRNLYLHNNQITFVSEAIANSQFEWCYLNGNKLLFILDKENNRCLDKSIVCSKLNEFINYDCISNFSMLVKLNTLEAENTEAIKNSFSLLKREDQCLIFEMIYLESGITSEDAEWGEHHVFDDMHLFRKALRRAISDKFDRLSQEDKNRVYEEIYLLAGKPETDDSKCWGGNHAFKHVLRFIDAMEKAGF